MAKGVESITDATGSTTFGPGTQTDGVILINRGPNTCFVEKDGATATESGFNLAINEAVNTKDLPGGWNGGIYTAVCAAGETATLYWND